MQKTRVTTNSFIYNGEWPQQFKQNANAIKDLYTIVSLTKTHQLCVAYTL